MSRRRPVPYTQLEDIELVRLFDAGDQRAYAELARRHTPMCARKAREYCEAIWHRGHRRACKGDECDGAYGPVFERLLDRLIGHPADKAARRRRLVGVIERYDEGPKVLPLGAFFLRGLRSGGTEEARRAYCVDRGLHVKLHWRKEFNPTILVAVWSEWVLPETDPSTAFEDLGFTPEDLPRIVHAMWIDAIEVCPADNDIDLRRVASLLKLPALEDEQASKAQVARLDRVVRTIDALIAVAAPDFYDDYLGRPRDLSRRATEEGVA